MKSKTLIFNIITISFLLLSCSNKEKNSLSSNSENNNLKSVNVVQQSIIKSDDKTHEVIYTNELEERSSQDFNRILSDIKTIVKLEDYNFEVDSVDLEKKEACFTEERDTCRINYYMDDLKLNIVANVGNNNNNEYYVVNDDKEKFRNEILTPHLNRDEFDPKLYIYNYKNSNFYKNMKKQILILSNIEFASGLMTNVVLCEIIDLDKKKVIRFFYDMNQ